MCSTADLDRRPWALAYESRNCTSSSGRLTLTFILPYYPKYSLGSKAVEALKEAPGDELQVWGSGQLLQTLLRHQVVDRFRLMTFPVVLGSGRRLFNDGILPATMRPVDVIVTDVGIVIGTYEPAGPVRYGEM